MFNTIMLIINVYVLCGIIAMVIVDGFMPKYSIKSALWIVFQWPRLLYWVLTAK